MLAGNTERGREREGERERERERGRERGRETEKKALLQGTGCEVYPEDPC